MKQTIFKTINDIAMRIGVSYPFIFLYLSVIGICVDALKHRHSVNGDVLPSLHNIQ